MSRFIMVNNDKLIDIDKFDGVEKSNSSLRIYFYYKFSNSYDGNEDYYYVEYNTIEELNKWFDHIMKCLNVEPNSPMFSPEYPM